MLSQPTQSASGKSLGQDNLPHSEGIRQIYDQLMVVTVQITDCQSEIVANIA